MLCITEAAGTRLEQLLTTAQVPEEASVRLVNEGGDLKLAFDRPRAEDTALDHNGRTVLVVDPSVAQLLDAQTLDILQTPEGSKLVLK
jgi:Fe-S cluster assembly iron-binding protein IscA